jgi:hypothetical protein
MLSAASGQVTPVDEFIGESSEGFEGRTTASGMCVQDGVFGGLGELCATNAFLTSSNTWTCRTTPRTGGRFFISTFSEAEFTFSAPVTMFGGYFSAGHPGAPGATVDFFDEGGNLIDSVEADIPLDCTWTWQGWSSPTPIARIIVQGNVSAGVGGLIGMDDMQIGSAPPPPDPCYADCDTSTGAGVLDLYDVLCFQESFLAGDPYACDADTSTGAGVCDVFDFLAYMESFLEGCEPNDPPTSVPIDLDATIALLAAELLELRGVVCSLDDEVVTGRNRRADWIRRWLLAWHVSAAHDALIARDLRRADWHLERFLKRVDGVRPWRDWVAAGPERDELANTVGAMISVVDLLREEFGDGDQRRWWKRGRHHRWWRRAWWCRR